MIEQLLILFGGLALIIIGAEFLVKGASGIARIAGISEFVIGLTIVAIGTSAPEMVVSVVGAAEGNSDVSAGNVMGSNIFNGLVILGLVALIRPITITKTNRSFDIPWYIVLTVVVFLLGKYHSLFGIGSDDIITRISAAVFLLIFSLFIYLSFKKGGKKADEDSPAGPAGKLWLLILMLAAGLAMLVFGGRLFVDAAVNVAHIAGLSDKFIAITVLAFGTSLPELATSVIAAFQGKSQLALGNVLGSNIFNLLLILGTSALISPVNMHNINFIDFGSLLLGAALLCGAALRKGSGRLERVEGIILVAMYAGYMIYLFNNL